LQEGTLLATGLAKTGKTVSNANEFLAPQVHDVFSRFLNVGIKDVRKIVAAA